MPKASSGGIDSLLSNASAEPIRLAARLNAAARDSGLTLTVWPRNDSVSIDSTKFVVHDHPCGAVLAASFRSMPVADSLIDPERVVEFDAAGKRVREWRVPTDQLPLAIQGDELFMSFRDDLMIALKPDGSFRIAPRVVVPEPSELTCPSPQVFAQSAYERCGLFADLLSRAERRIAFEGPCT